MSVGTSARTTKVVKVDRVEDSATPVELEHEEVERRCTHALLAILPKMRHIIGHDREGEPPAITVQQYSVLKALKDQERLISELADMLKVSRPTMSRIIDGLEGRRRGAQSETSARPKLVERVACQDDHRLVYARITEEGQTVLQNYRVQAEEKITSILRRLEPNELPVLLHGLENLARVVAFEEA